MLDEAVEAWLTEDGAFDDATSQAVIPEQARARGRIEAREAIVVAGTEAALAVFERVGAKADATVEDGERVEAGDVLVEVEGPARAVLAGERVALNVLGRLSAIATATRRAVDAVQEANPDCQVLATRKTTPGLRGLEHEAVLAGGGAPHRGDLSTAVLVKENHLAFVTISEAVEAARSHDPQLYVMVEAETPGQAAEVARTDADGVLLDNFEPELVEDTVELVKRLSPAMDVEASGGITPGTVQAYAEHVDRVSLGSITHSSGAVDLSMRIHPVTDGESTGGSNGSPS